MKNLLKRQWDQLFLYLIISTFFSSCGDIFDYQEKIVRNYYLTEIDSRKSLSIGYRVGGGFLTKVPPRVLAYCIVGDSLLIAKTKDDINNDEKIYIINMRKDSDAAKPENYLVVPPMSVVKYKSEWEKVLHAKFISVPANYK
ncbi:MAG TPA: hypothetical protein VK518_11105 [Puia sp.]|nr:hypothetical protein [Puia sp.]